MILHRRRRHESKQASEFIGCALLTAIGDHLRRIHKTLEAIAEKLSD
jgi:hypothetical protein